MMDEGEDQAICAAVSWHLRLCTARSADWQAFTAWLEADPAHRRAYDEISLAEAELDDALALNDWSHGCQRVAANDQHGPAYRGWKIAGGGGLVAASLAAIFLWTGQDAAPRLDFVETPPGVQRALRLADGTRIELNGGTRLGIDGSSNRRVALDRGEAIFHVVHDAARPFIVESGATRLQDVGTTFNVSRVGAHMSVQVAEGAVLFQPEGDRIMLTQGAALSHVDGEPAHMSGVAAQDVGAWRKGRLVFQQTPLRLVVAALERSTGSGIQLGSDLKDTPFTGSIRIAGGSELMAPRLAAMVGARAMRQNGRWTLVRGDHAAP